MVLAQSRGTALNKGFADIKKSGGNSGFRSKVGVRLQLGVRLVIQDLRYTIKFFLKCVHCVYRAVIVIMRLFQYPSL